MYSRATLIPMRTRAAPSRPRRGDARARAEAQAGPDADEQDGQGEKRRLALERRGPGPDVAKAGQAGQDEERADKQVHRGDYPLESSDACHRCHARAVPRGLAPALAPPVTATRVLEVSGLQPVVNAVALSPDGSLAVVGDFDDDLIAREVRSGAERWKVRVRPRGEQRRIDGAFFSPDGSLIVTTGHEARTLEMWNAATGRSVAVLDVGKSRGVAFHPDERMLAVAGAGTIHVVDLDSSRVVRALPNAHAGDAIFAIAFSGDGQTLATISGKEASRSGAGRRSSFAPR